MYITNPIKKEVIMQKRILTLGLILSISVLTATASQLNVKMTNHSGFYVVLDHQLYSGYTFNHTFYHVAPGYHYMKIYQVQSYGHLSHHKKIIFKGEIHVPANTRLKAIVDPLYGVKIITSKKEIGKKRVVSKKSNNYVYHKPIKKKSVYHHMNHVDFRFLRDAMLDASFDNTRLSIAKNALNHHRLSSRQVADLALLFSFESNRLEFVKRAYHRVVDPGSYYIVYTALKYDSSKRSLDRYINSR
jgi:hypothetical protein